MKPTDTGQGGQAMVGSGREGSLKGGRQSSKRKKPGERRWESPACMALGWRMGKEHISTKLAPAGSQVFQKGPFL